jgi:hypothetical protein
LGKEVAAYSQAGKPLGKEAVLKALAKPTMAVCFVRSNADYPEKPDPVYLEVFREEAVILVYHARDKVR